MISKVFLIVMAAASMVLSSPVALERRVDATNITCTDATANIDEHNKNVATLSICGGIAGTIEKCEGAPTSTEGASGDAKFTLNPTVAGATINISKGRWEQCIDSAEAVCPGGQAYTATCPGGASSGDIDFALTKQ
ncbi:hypothetical protein M406DRAFT_330464 [Cryphonectria parasitica EP155]|uniref:Uncharacterized protein n=1 Tax=Cryphonectria parasitica (strain ATCC 38755 / EP155) TaxID=660469 RepID=A0A9P4Y0X5_CRYP1|nr:uncharacterized protein M406DRAFT_330464 [Cryphonectria parasitica EP155]KAF3764115.1 hypothetical protein M406DRAFT_330464 [Cryphonectria parasitica EP155]